MSGLVQEFLQNWEAELFQLRSSDPLIDLTDVGYARSEEELWLQNKSSEQLRKECKKIERERGVLALVQFEGLLTFQKKKKLVQSPVFLRECEHINWKTQQIQLEDTFQINPFIVLYLRKELQIDLHIGSKEEIVRQLLKTGLFISYEPSSGFANLHPQRYELRKEWESLRATAQFSNAVHQIIGDVDQIGSGQSTAVSSKEIMALDPDQRLAIQKANEGSLVIYGPPGTGKSVVLTSIIAQALYARKEVLVVADKPVALDVIVGKLAQHGLDQFCIQLDNSSSQSNFFKKLKGQFETLHQAARTAISPFNQQFVGADFWEQKRQLEKEANHRFRFLLDTFQPLKDRKVLPSKRWLQWLKAKEQLTMLDTELSMVLAHLSSQWQQKQPADLLEDAKQWTALYEKLQAAIHLQSLDDLNDFVEKSLRCIQFEGNVYKNYAQLLDTAPEKQLKRLIKYQQLCLQEQKLKEELVIWRQIPTMAEWELLKSLAIDSSWLKRRKWRKLEQNWLRSSGIPMERLEKPLQKYWQIQTQKAQLETLFIGLGISNLETQSGTIIALLKQHKTADWQWYKSLPYDEIQLFCRLHHAAHQFQQLQKQLFTTKTTDFPKIQELINVCLNQLLDKQKLLREIPYELWQGLFNLDQLKEQVTREFWADLRYHYPALYAVQKEEIIQLLDRDLTTEALTWQQNAKQLIHLQYAQFHELQSLLEKPLNQLNAQQKERRKELRKGKAILVKEMAKTKQHISLKALFEGPAEAWLRAIFPIWFATPTALAKNLQLCSDLFHYGLFDEASQMPLSHAIGAVQRVTQIVVAGDPQQMRPQSYFNQNTEGVVDLLHQAAFYLPSAHLRHHYRSEDPRLIAFSNAHFYGQSLMVWPSKYNKKHGVFDHFISDGIYTHQRNVKEAKALASDLSQRLLDPQKIGVVAFSESQLICIFEQLSQTDQSKLEQRIQERSAFFLPLEQVQGEECEILLISFGYGKNEDGQFSLKLGPMIQAQGTRRLNVLLTRAQKALHFYSSIRAADFPSKRSEASQKIWDWFVFMEQYQSEEFVANSQERLDLAPDYATYLNYYRVLKQREAPLQLA